MGNLINATCGDCKCVGYKKAAMQTETFKLTGVLASNV